MTKVKVKNVYDKPLQQHSSDSPKDQPKTGYLRDGYCDSPAEDKGNHSVAAVLTDEFLDFTASKGNDLRKQVPGLKGGFNWCVCANRWKEAFDAAKGSESDKRVPKVRLDATNIRALDVVGFKDLKKYAGEQQASNASTRAIDPQEGGHKYIKESSEIGGSTEREAKG